MEKEKAIVYKPNLRKRAIAVAIDSFICFSTVALIMAYFGEKQGKEYHLKGIAATFPIIFWLMYFVIVESVAGGTLGHKVMGLRVITISGNDISIAQSIKRHLLDPFDYYFLIPALVTIKNTDKHQRLGDLWAKTIVVDELDPQQFKISR